MEEKNYEWHLKRGHFRQSNKNVFLVFNSEPFFLIQLSNLFCIKVLCKTILSLQASENNLVPHMTFLLFPEKAKWLLLELCLTKYKL